MEQPKYKMGEEINILIPMCHEGAEMHIIHETTGIICGISYDPNDLSSNAPYYDYKVRPKKANNSLYFGENKIRKMKQPKYKMGEKINILIPMCHEGAEMHIMHKTTGIICGISYDPMATS